MQRAWVLVVLTLVILAFALATGHPMFWRTFYVFGLLLAVSGLWVWSLGRGVDVEVRRPPLRTRAGSVIREHVTVRRKNRFLRGFIEVREQTDMPIKAPGAVLGMGDAEQFGVDLELPCPRRGAYRLGPARASASDPFGLFVVNRSIGSSQRLIVHPATIELPGFILLPADLPGEGPRHVRSQHVTTSAYGVRDYVFGDSLNRISWKSSAHHDRLMVKEFEVEPANNIWVLVDMERKAHHGSGDDSTEETVVTLAASIARRYLDANYPVGFMAYGNERYAISAQRGSGQLLRVMDALSELRAQGNTPLLELIAALHVKAGRYTSVAIVTPSAQTEWLAGVRHLLERKSRITVVVVDAELGKEQHPESAMEAAALGVPTYAVKRAAADQIRMTPLTAHAYAAGFEPARLGRR